MADKTGFRYPEAPMSFVHLHLHSHYTLLNSTIRITDLVDKAVSSGVPAVALTDTMNVFGSLELEKKIRGKGVKPIYGAELLISTDPGVAPFSLVVLCRNREGFANLREILSRAATESPRDDCHCTTRDILASLSKGLIGLSGSLGGQIPHAILTGGQAEQLASEYASIFEPGCFFLELQGNDLEEQKTVNRELAAIGQRIGLPCVATNNVHYLERSDAPAHAILVAIGQRKRLSFESLDNFPLDSFHFASEADMRRAFCWIPEAVDNTVKIAEMIEPDILFSSQKHFFPVYQPPEGMTVGEYLTKLAKEGLADRLANSRKTGFEKDPAEYWARLDRELEVIIGQHFDTYYLVVWDFINWSRQNDVPVGPGRGSGAGSLVAYSIGITDVDPLSYDLLFERFLNSERISPPDFDIDFCKDERSRTIEYVTNRYGREQVCQIVTFGSLKARAAIKDAARVLGFSFDESDVLTKMIPEEPGMTLARAAEIDSRIEQVCKSDARFGRLWEVALKLEGLARQTGKHAAGVVIADRPVKEYAPLYVNDDGSIVTQYDMANLDTVGLIKFDFLGLLSLTIIAHALKNIRARKDPGFDLGRIPLDDRATFDLLCSGRTAGVFQLETRGITNQVKRLRPDTLEDIVATIALFRPGPLQNKMDEEFIAVKHGQKKAQYAHPLLEPILKDTYGTILYQEQVMLIASRLGGFSLGQADILRKGMGKKDHAAIERQKDPFIKGCSERGIPTSVSRELFEKLEKFGSYGFNKSHSVAYAYVSYQMAYMKTHFPVEFICAVLYAKKGNQSDVMRFIYEAQESGIPVLPPDVNRSQADFTVEDVKDPDGTTKGAIRFGLTAVKGVGTTAIALVLKAREDGPFESVADFLARIDKQKVNRKVVESLIKAGAFDAFGHTRRSLAEGINQLFDAAARLSEDRESGQGGLFDLSEDTSVKTVSGPPPLPEWPQREKLALERDALGYYVTGHPIHEYRDSLAKFDVLRLSDMDETMSGKSVQVAGMVLTVEEKISKKTGDPMAFLQIDDGTGQLECSVFSKHYHKWESVRNSPEPLLFSGRLDVETNIETEESRYRLLCDGIQRLDDARRLLTKSVRIHVDACAARSQTIDEMYRIVKNHPGPTPIEIEMVLPGTGRMMIRANSRWAVDPSEELLRELRQLLDGHECGCGPTPIEIN